MSDDTSDLHEAVALEAAAAWRLRKVDADPTDTQSLRAARQLGKLAAELRGSRGSKTYLEYAAMLNWLGESDGVSDLRMNVEYFNQRLGFGVWAEDGEAYLRALIEMAKEVAGLA
jgi:hypothetical protein